MIDNQLIGPFVFIPSSYRAKSVAQNIQNKFFSIGKRFRLSLSKSSVNTMELLHILLNVVRILYKNFIEKWQSIVWSPKISSLHSVELLLMRFINRREKKDITGVCNWLHKKLQPRLSLMRQIHELWSQFTGSMGLDIHRRLLAAYKMLKDMNIHVNDMVNLNIIFRHRWIHHLKLSDSTGGINADQKIQTNNFAIYEGYVTIMYELEETLTTKNLKATGQDRLSKGLFIWKHPKFQLLHLYNIRWKR